MKPIIKHYIISYISWLFRRPSAASIALRSSAGLIAIILGIGSLAGSISFQGVTIDVLQDDAISTNLLNVTLLVVVLVFFASFILLTAQFVLDRRAESKMKVIVVEGRGLRDDDGKSLADSLNDDYPKSRIPHVLDLRQRQDGKIFSPELLLPKISAVKESINQTRFGNGRENTQVVYGGLTSVPLTFLTGVELDDEGAISVLDWDRSLDKWRELDDLDDGLRLSEPELENFALPEAVVLAIAVSYPIEQDDLATTFEMPILRMELQNRSSSSHWSAEKQSRIADQFFETAKDLSAHGVKHIHLVLAAPNSVVFNFGRRYDKRNLPEITVYQYERAEEIKYPWGVRMPVGKTSAASVVRKDAV